MKKIIQSLSLLSLFCFCLVLTGCELDTGILNPKGVVAFEQRQILFDSTALMLMVVLSVIIMSIAFVYHYRVGNPKYTEYKPEWSHNSFLEAVWWGIPIFIILILSVMTWINTHKLDPYNKLNNPFISVEENSAKPMNIQVVALPWKWLFIYPEYNIATVNYVALPNKTQVEFHLTTDNVPMSSFIIPQLGSQIYTMAGMRTRLHLIPTHVGKFEGLNSQFNGEGFSEMRFETEVFDNKQFDAWVAEMQKQPKKLDRAGYNNVRQYSTSDAPQYFSQIEPDLFNNIISAYNSATHPLQLNTN